MANVRALRPRLYHRAAKIRSDGAVSALCFSKPRAINLSKSSWTNRDEAVTCPRCKAAIRAAKATS